MHIEELNYHANGSELFKHFAHLPWAVFLDSTQATHPDSRYDIISAFPHTTLTTIGAQTKVENQGQISYHTDDPFLLLKKQLSPFSSDATALPFNGGAIGYFAYDLAYRLEKLPKHAQNDTFLPEMQIGIYDWAIITDHQIKKTFLALHPRISKQQRQHILNVLNTPEISPMTAQILNPLQTTLSYSDYQKAFMQIKQHLQAGDCYQVNLTQRFKAQLIGSTWQTYCLLRQKNPAPFSAFLHYPSASIMSLSPERFLHLQDRCVSTNPIKGTRPRGNNPSEDQMLAHELLHSEKDRAENMMIVDLLRNDLSKNCLPHSVKVPHFCELYSFPAVHHLVSTVTGALAAEIHATTLLRDCFPGGSITGAPKIRAMEIIDALEPTRRGIYCGSIGYIDYNGNMDTNIAIRTLVHQQTDLFCYAGGGIVIDSDCEREYAECFSKIDVIARTLASIRSNT